MNNKKLTPPTKNLIKVAIIVTFVAIIVAGVIFIDGRKVTPLKQISLEEGQAIVDTAFSSLPESIAKSALLLSEKSAVTVKSIEKGTGREFILDCEYTTVDIAKIVEESKNELFASAYGYYSEREAAGKKTGATSIMIEVGGIILEKLNDAETITGKTKLYIYQLNDGTNQLYLSNDAVNNCLGGILDAINSINETTEITYEGEVVSIKNLNTIKSGVSNCIALKNYDKAIPNTGTPLTRWWSDISEEFHRNFIQKDHWKYLAKGLLTTLEITFLSLIMGVVLGFLVAIIRVTNSKTGKVKFFDFICRIYISVIRGTPVMVQLLIIYFVLLLPNGIEKFPAAVICFGLNSGAYVAEIVRGGIMSVVNGQTEAGRSLGFTYAQTMFYIVIPQAFKAVLPSLANEFITLLKESSVAFYIGVADLTQGGIKIRSITYSNFMPLIAVALIYLVLVLGLSSLVNLLEKRLQKGDR